MIKFKGFRRGDPVQLSVSDTYKTVGPVDVDKWNVPYPTYSTEQTQDAKFGVSVSMGNARTSYAPGFIPKSRIHTQVVAEVDGRKLRVDGIDNSNHFRDRAWIGATVDAYRIVSGDRVLVGTFTVADAKFGEWVRQTANRSTAHTQAGGFTHFQDNYGTSDDNWEMRPRWFGVAAVDSGNQIGAMAYAEYTPTSLASGSDLDNDNTIDLGENFTIGGALPAPANVTATVDASGPRTANITHDTVTDAIGYMHFISYDDPATHPIWKFIEVDGDGIKAGDEIVVRRSFAGALSTDWLATRTMGMRSSQYGFGAIYPGSRYENEPAWATRNQVEYSAIPYDGLDPDAGDWALKVDIGPDFGTGGLNLYMNYWNAQATQSWYPFVPVGERYRFLVRVWASRTAQITVDIGLNGSPTQTYTVSPGWQTLELLGSPTSPTPGPRPAIIQLQRDGDPIEIRLAGTDLREVNTDNLFPPKIADQLLPGMVVRDPAFIKAMPRGYTIYDLLTVDCKGYTGYSINQFLKSCLAASVKPWIQIEPFISPAEWEFFGDYLYSPVASGKAGALHRQELGRDDPWSNAFDEIFLEFGNESWNALTSFYRAPTNGVDSVTSEEYNSAEYFGMISRQAAQVMMDSQYWADNITFVMGGWASQAWYAENLLRGFRLPCHIGIANYNGGWDTGGDLVTEDDQSYQNVLASTASKQIDEMDNLVAGLQEVCAEVGLTYQTDVRPTCYEAGPGYQFSGLNGATLTNDEIIKQEVVMKSIAAGTATLHTALAQAARGFAYFNFFVIDTGDYWKSQASDAQGGGVYPSWQVIRKLHEVFGKMRVVEAQADFPDLISVQDHRGDDATVDSTFAYLVESDSHAQRKGLVAGNISIVQPEICLIDSGWTPADVTALTGWFLNGSYDAHNRYPVGQRLSPDGSYVPDPKSVGIDILGMSLQTPDGLPVLQTDLNLGFDVDGIGRGNCGFIVADA